MPKVTFATNDISVTVGKGETVLDAAMRAGVPIAATCGGSGTCGKCRVIVEKGTVRGGRGPRLSKAHAEDGHVLACRAEVFEDTVVSVPVETSAGKVPARPHPPVLTAEDLDRRVPELRIDPIVRRTTLDLKPPTLSDTVDDVQRLSRALRSGKRTESARVGLNVLRRLPNVVREADWHVEATVCRGEEGVEVVDVRPPQDSSEAYAVALDIGTTTVVGQLVSLDDGRVVAEASEYNAQVAHGADVISRIVHASKPVGLDSLRRLVLGSVRAIVNQLLDASGAREDDVISYVAAGNTTMAHLFLGISPAGIREEPYVPVARSFPWLSARELGLPGAEEARLLVFPCPASYVGGDIVAGVLASGIPWSDELILYIDIGTNGELVLGNKDWTVACACSAGPAFEGGGVLHGMRAAEGAIEQVRVDPETLEPMLLTIAHASPVGVCGSGFVGCVAELFLAGALEPNGRFDRSRACDRLREGEHGWEYVLVQASESGTGRDIVITEGDVENLLRAKAAVFAGIGVLMESVDVSFDEIGQVLVAGTFGRYLEIDEVLTIGLFPELPAERFHFVGNGALQGARLVALSRDMARQANKVAESMTYLELSINAAFMDMYMSAMFLPHTDAALFPGVVERAAAKKVAR